MPDLQLTSTLSRQKEPFKALKRGQAGIYSCGPTVYDHAHIGNLLAFLMADTLARTLRTNGYKVLHIMNYTDVDDKTIRRSHEDYPDVEPMEALTKTTDTYKRLFRQDIEALNIAHQQIKFIDATAEIEAMQELILRLLKDEIAYIADDGIYFSIEKYQQRGGKYGQLTKVTAKSTGAARVNNDEYDKDSVHDFVLWKAHRGQEPAWDFEVPAHGNMPGRPGWHIECSAMAEKYLGKPFDIHTGGQDLIFPHHENEIAQSTAGQNDGQFANYFVHNEMIMVDGRKMSKSLNNFYTLEDIKSKGYLPLAFRLLVLQSHYRSPLNFTWDSLAAAQNFLKQTLWPLADRSLQAFASGSELKDYQLMKKELVEFASDDLNTAGVLTVLARLADSEPVLSDEGCRQLKEVLQLADDILGLNLVDREDIEESQKTLIKKRSGFKADHDYDGADQLRDELTEQGIGLRDMAAGTVWYRL